MSKSEIPPTDGIDDANAPTDYDHPQWFWDDDTTDEERNIWYTQRRALKQALNQKTPTARATKKKMKRIRRRFKAKNSTVDLEKYR